ncbi:hypothetical protein A4A49_52257, partial [Nicotiana attenuata]
WTPPDSPWYISFRLLEGFQYYHCDCNLPRGINFSNMSDIVTIKIDDQTGSVNFMCECPRMLFLSVFHLLLFLCIFY